MCVSVFQEHLYVDTLFQDLTKVVLSCFSCRAKKESMSSLIQPCPPSQNKTFTKCRLIYYWSTCPFSFFPFLENGLWRPQRGSRHRPQMSPIQKQASFSHCYCPLPFGEVPEWFAFTPLHILFQSKSCTKPWWIIQKNMTCIFIKPLFISLLLLEEDQSCSSSSNVCLESKRAKREKSAMYRILSNVTGKRKDFSRITNSDPIGKHEVCECWGESVHRAHVVYSDQE